MYLSRAGSFHPPAVVKPTSISHLQAFREMLLAIEPGSRAIDSRRSQVPPKGVLRRTLFR
jgi:hypothetical protein